MVRPSIAPIADDNRCVKSGRNGLQRCSLPRSNGSLFCVCHNIMTTPSASKSEVRKPNKIEEEEEEDRQQQQPMEIEEEDDQDHEMIKVEKGKQVLAANDEGEGVKTLRLGEIWGLSQDFDGFPRSYARIECILPMQSELRVMPLVHLPMSEEEELLAEKGICSLPCGVFEPVEYTLFEKMSAFTHKVEFNFDKDTGSYYEIFPKTGQIWAIYLKWEEGERSFEYKLVEVLSDSDEVVNVSALVKVEGRRRIYKRQICEGFSVIQSFSGGVCQCSHTRCLRLELRRRRKVSGK